MLADVLERDAELATLVGAVTEAAAGRGAVALVSGEAGIGKTTLVHALRDALDDVRVLVGACDDLLTPRSLGPFRDIARAGGTRLAAVLDGGDRDQVFDAVLAEVSDPLRPTVLVLEDVHWADDATLDVARFLVRRVRDRPTLVVLTFRDDELTVDHPLQAVLGGLAGQPAHRLPLRPLSHAGIERLVGERPLAPAAIAAVTGGNPFFVTELIATDAEALPATVVDAVLARLRRLSPDGRGAAHQLSVVPTHVDTALAHVLVGAQQLAELEQHGLVEVTPTHVAFRHELARRVVEDAVGGTVRMQMHRRVLESLLATGDADPARVVHHAQGAGDVERLIEHAPVAAAEASRAGAHRQALAHYGSLLEHLDRFDEARQAHLIEQHAIESYWVGRGGEALASQRRAVALRRRLTDADALGASLGWLSRLHWGYGDGAEAVAAADEAIEVLERAAPATAELAMAYSRRAQLLMLSYDDRAAIELAQRAADLARDVGASRIVAHALCNQGTSLWRIGDETGRAVLEESLAIARREGADEDACRAYTCIVWQLLERHRHEEGRALCQEALAFAERTEQLVFVAYLRATLGSSLLDTGELEAAEALAREVLTQPEGIADLPAMVVLARVLTRRGADGADALLQEAWPRAVRTTELQRIGPVAVALGEHAWTTGQPELAHEPLDRAARLAIERAAPRALSELRYWQWKLGGDVEPVGDDPWSAQIRGAWDDAAVRWERHGQPFEHALALAESGEPTPMLEALDILDRLGARPAAAAVRSGLRAAGVARVPRGPQAATRTNPAGLTDRQLEVLGLVADGLTNAEIAERLVLSVRTVDHHVSAILQRLGVASREEAAVRAATLTGRGATPASRRPQA